MDENMDSPNVENSSNALIGEDKKCKVSYSQLMIIAIVVGAILGIILNLTVDDTHRGEVTKWISFPGALFIRALKCLVIPMVFCNMVVGVAELSGLGQTGAIGGRTFALYMTTTLVAAIEGVVTVSIFSGLFSGEKSDSLCDYLCDLLWLHAL